VQDESAPLSITVLSFTEDQFLAILAHVNIVTQQPMSSSSQNIIPHQSVPPKASDIADAVGGRVFGPDCKVTCVRPISRLVQGCLSFATGRKLAIDADAGAVILVRSGQATSDRNTYIEVKNPRLAFATALTEFFERPVRPDIATSARVAKRAKLGDGVCIGEHVVVEEDVTIGARSIVQHNVVIHSGTQIGDDCIISAGVIIGAAGFGYERDAAGVPHRIPHLGKVRIGSDVHIGPNSTIARGTLSDTLIGDHTKIGTLVNIHHNAQIGTSCLIAGHSQISGSVSIGDRCWLGSNCTIRQSVVIGNGATIGLGVLVLEDIAASASIIGHTGVDIADDKRVSLSRISSAMRSRTVVPHAAFDQAVDEFVREALKLDGSFPISDSLTPHDVPGWDSLAHVNLLLDAQKRFGASFDVETMADIRSIGDLRRNLRVHINAVKKL
jgi:UDP-3-O-[3-hydroxymyristoyl] glucosamine N-acyltransferase